MTRQFLANTLDIFQNLSAASFQWKDFFDILVVAFLIYAVLLLLKRTHSFLILGGIVVLVLVYFGARFFNLYLTGMIFQYFWTSFILILVVIFQKELRNFLEWISISGRLAAKKKAISGWAGEAIVKTAVHLAEHKIGALIVMSGKQPVDRLLEGGIVLDGKISVPLLLSIFDPSSPGHDGAVVSDGDRLKKFGVHLPLAVQFKKFGNLGTRHRAALGLAQSSDALVIVVSEERGVISLAYQGDLRPLSGEEELKDELEKFLNKEAPEKRPLWRVWFTKNRREKIIAGALACVLWFIFVLQFGITAQEFQVPIEFRFLPKGLIIDQLNPKEITVLLSGRSQDFQLLNAESDLKILIDSSDWVEGSRSIKIDKSFINRPDPLAVAGFTPKLIQLHIIRAGTNGD